MQSRSADGARRIGLVVLAAWFGVTFLAVRLAIISATRVVQPVRPVAA
jgi:hypothetical protein